MGCIPLKRLLEFPLNMNLIKGSAIYAQILINCLALFILRQSASNKQYIVRWQTAVNLCVLRWSSVTGSVTWPMTFEGVPLALTAAVGFAFCVNPPVPNW